MISKEVLPTLIEIAASKYNSHLKLLRKTLMGYSKGKGPHNHGRKYFLIAVEEVDLKYGQQSNGVEQVDCTGDDGDHERTEQDEIFNHVMVEEGYNTHSPLEDIVKANAAHHVIDLEEDNEEGDEDEDEDEEGEDDEYIGGEDDDDDDDMGGEYADPSQFLSEEEIMAKMPPYYNKNNRQKKKFFKTLNKQYMSRLRNPRKGENGDKPRVNFNLKKNLVKKFKKSQKVSG